MRVLVAVLAGCLVFAIMHPLKWRLCSTDDEAHGQTWAMRERLSEHIQTGYQKQIERLYALLYEGYLTRPESEKEEDEKFKRGIRVARRARERAIDMIAREPWEIITPLPLPPAPTRPSDAPRWHGPANTR